MPRGIRNLVIVGDLLTREIYVGRASTPLTYLHEMQEREPTRTLRLLGVGAGLASTISLVRIKLLNFKAKRRWYSAAAWDYIATQIELNERNHPMATNDHVAAWIARLNATPRLAPEPKPTEKGQLNVDVIRPEPEKGQPCGACGTCVLCLAEGPDAEAYHEAGPPPSPPPPQKLPAWMRALARQKP